MERKTSIIQTFYGVLNPKERTNTLSEKPMAHMFNRKGGSNNVHMEVIKLWRESWQIEKVKGHAGHFTEACLWVHIYF